MGKIYTIDATGKSIGRVASEAALVLQGKRLVTYRPDRLPTPFQVEVKNISSMRIVMRKMREVHHRSHSQYPGALRETTFEQAFKKNPEAMVRRIVEKMLPKNRLSQHLLKRIIISR